MSTIVPKLDTAQVQKQEVDRDPSLSSKNSKDAYKRDLKQFDAWRTGRRLTLTLVEEYASSMLSRGVKVSTINRKLTAIRWWSRRLAKLAFEDQNMTQEDKQELITMADQVAKVRNVRGDAGKSGRHLAKEEIEKLIATCQADSTPFGVRDAAMFAVLRVTGMRRFELLGLSMGDVDQVGDDDDPVFELVVRGKGNKTRSLVVNNGAALHLRDWFELRGSAPGAVFCPIDRWSHEIQVDPLSANSFNKIKDKRVKESGVREFVLHDWRRTFAGDLWEEGIDGSTIADLMGHKNINQTREYDRRPEEVKRQAVRRLYVPYKKQESHDEVA